MQSLHQLEKRAEVHRLEALKKIEALSETPIEEQELGPEAVATEDEPTEPAVRSVPTSHQHR